MAEDVVVKGQNVYPRDVRLDGPRYRHTTRQQRDAWHGRFEEVNRKYRDSLDHGEDPCIPHAEWHVMAFIDALAGVPSGSAGSIVEAGVFKGVSSAKISLVAQAMGRKLHLFDSFKGLPDNDECHEKSIMGHSIRGWFEGGQFLGTRERVQKTLRLCGAPNVCELHEGWFEDTLPDFNEPVAAAYLDCDLASSTRTCLQHLYPLLVPGGVIVSQDGDFPLVIDVYKDDALWDSVAGSVDLRPEILGLGYSKIIVVRKPGAQSAAERTQPFQTGLHGWRA